jgi:hypothetical protein
VQPNGAKIDANRALAITRAFFDTHLRCQPQPLLAEPSPNYPKVTFID